MSSDTITNPVALTQTESNTSRKKKAKAEAVASEANATAPATPGEETSTATNGESSNDSPYIKELQKQVRNVAKKLNAMAKVDSIVAENPGKSLDELLASRKINADQKAQALKKSSLQASLSQLEEQLAQYKKVDADYQTRMSNDRETLTTSHKAEIEQLRDSLKKEAQEEARTELRKKLLIFSQFLRAAAAKRLVEEDANTDESKAFEGALLLVYGGDDKAVDAAENLIEGADEAVTSVEGVPLSVKYSEVKQLSVEHAPFPADDGFAESVQESAAATQPTPDTEEASQDTQTDPTIANAGLTELGAGGQAPPPMQDETSMESPAQVSAGDEMANKAGGTTWDKDGGAGGTEDLEESFEMVPRDPAETDTPHQPAFQNQTSSWADDTAADIPIKSADPVAAPEMAATPAAPTDDGFHEVERKRGGHRGQRGDGGEGRGRGRGRGGFRGGERGGERGRGGHRGERRGGGENRGRGGRERGAPRV